MKKCLNKMDSGFLKKGSSDIGEEDLKGVLGREKDIMKILTGRLGEFVGDVRTFFMLLNDYWNGRYRAIPWWAISSVVFTLLYVLNPLDMIPDAIPVLGLLDDATVMTICLKMVQVDIENYKSWLEQNRNVGKTV